MVRASPWKRGPCHHAVLRRGRGCNCSTKEQSASIAKGGRTKRKASAEKKSQRKWKRLFEVGEPCGEEYRIKGGMRKEREDGEGQPQKKSNWEASGDGKSDTFEAKYMQLTQLGRGGCGSVFAGYRKEDNLQVAIKHIAQDYLLCKSVFLNGKKFPAEVAIMLKLAAGTDGSLGASAPVSLLDWYDLGHELILVLERPVPAVDLFTYIQDNRGSLLQEEAKTILRQLVDGAKLLEDRQIFHRDIKTKNILIEKGSGVLRVRLIDFGLSCIAKKGSFYSVFYGTDDYTPPEWYSGFTYRAGPSTVWQLGAVLFEMLHGNSKFETKKFLKNELRINSGLSKDCKNVLRVCLEMAPKLRPTLTELRLHPWLR